MKAMTFLRIALVAAAAFALRPASLGAQAEGGSVGGAPAATASAATVPAATAPAALDRPASELLGQARMDELLAKGSLSSLSSGSRTNLLPDWAGADPIRKALEEEKPQVLVEALFFYRRPAPQSRASREAELAYIYGLMREFSTLRGIKYYSQTQRAMETLYVDAYRVAGVADPTRLPDPPPPEIGKIPGSERFHVFLQDQRFGKNIYRYDYTSYPDGFFVNTTNETPMNFLFFTLFGPEKLKMRLLLIPTLDGILFYVESGASVPGFLRGLVSESFQNRAVALYDWFRDRFKEPAAP